MHTKCSCQGNKKARSLTWDYIINRPVIKPVGIYKYCARCTTVAVDFLGSLFVYIVSFSSRDLFIPTLAARYFVSSLVWCELKSHSTVLFLCHGFILGMKRVSSDAFFFPPLRKLLFPEYWVIQNHTKCFKYHQQLRVSCATNDSSVIFPVGWSTGVHGKAT